MSEVNVKKESPMERRRRLMANGGDRLDLITGKIDKIPEPKPVEETPATNENEMNATNTMNCDYQSEQPQQRSAIKNFAIFLFIVGILIIIGHHNNF